MGYRMLVRLVRAAFASAVTFHGHLVLVCEPLFPHHQTNQDSKSALSFRGAQD